MNVVLWNFSHLSHISVCLSPTGETLCGSRTLEGMVPSCKELAKTTGGERYTEMTPPDRKGLWGGDWWEWQREINSCWSKNVTCLFEKSFKMFPPSTSPHTHYDYASFPSLEPKNTLSHQPWVFIWSHQLVLVTLFYSIQCFPIIQE